ncbi:MAG TPA: tripartite tricarboxylate transporter substrate binding protein [Xanthobacteraceae bacterium]
MRIVVATAAGGATDILARLTGQWLTERLDQPFVVENRPGGGNNIGTEAVARAPADGTTLMMCNSVNTTNPSLYSNLSYDFLTDIIPVAAVSRAPVVMQVNPSVPAETGAEFLAYAKANPGKINMGSGGNGATGHMCGELFKMMAGVNLQHVPYRGEANALTGLLGGQVQVVFTSITSSIGYIRSGQLRGLGVSTATRSAALPDLPPIGDFVPGYEASSWNGMCAPKGTPAEIVDKLNKEINAALSDAKFTAKLAELGSGPFPGSAAEFGRFLAGDVEKWAKVVKFAGVKAE